MTTSVSSVSPPGGHRVRGRLKLALILLACAAPVLASYFTYYVLRPEGRTNYGELIEPQRPVGDVPVVTLEGEARTFSSLKGKWLMVTAASADCSGDCPDRLLQMRQVRLMTGRERDRIERVWLVTDPAVPRPATLEPHEGLHVLRVDAQTFARHFPAAPGGDPTRHIFIIDPLGNLMMRFPGAAEPARMKKDLSKLLRASRIG